MRDNQVDNPLARGPTEPRPSPFYSGRLQLKIRADVLLEIVEADCVEHGEEHEVGVRMAIAALYRGYSSRPTRNIYVEFEEA